MRDGRSRPTLWWLFGDTFRRERVHLRSPMPRTATHDALREAGLRGWRGMDPRFPIYGRFDAGRVVAWRFRWYARGSGLPCFIGQVVERTDGTELVGSIRLSRFARISRPLFALTFAAMTGIEMVARVWGNLAGAAMGLGLVVAIAHATTRVARSDWEFLRDTLREALAATEVTGEPPV